MKVHRSQGRRAERVFLARRLALLSLFGILLLSLPACFHSPGEGSTAGEEIYEVVMETITYGEDMPDLALVEEAVNAISVPAIGCKLKLLPVPIADHELQIPLMHRQGKKLDLINTGRTLALTSLVEEGMLLPLNELLPAHAPQLYEKSKAYLEACVISDNLYAVPASLYCGSRCGFFYNAQLAEELGLSIPEEMDLEALEELAGTLRRKGIYLMSIGNGADSGALMRTLYPGITPVDGSQFVTGAYMETEQGIALKNIYNTQVFLDYCLKMRHWKEEGYIPADMIYTEETVTELFSRGETFLLRIPVNPIEYVLQTKNVPFALGQICTGPATLSTYEIQENGWGISSSSERPEKALAFLDLIYSNATVANLLMNGIEGREYVKTGENLIARPEGKEGEPLGYARYFSIFGDLKDVYQWEPAGEDFPRQLEEFYGKVELGPFFGYTFDVKPVAAQYLAVSQILGSYMPALDCGLLSDVPGAVEELRRVLSQAGIMQVIRENQRQLADWLWEREEETIEEETTTEEEIIE